MVLSSCHAYISCNRRSRSLNPKRYASVQISAPLGHAVRNVAFSPFNQQPFNEESDTQIHRDALPKIGGHRDEKNTRSPFACHMNMLEFRLMPFLTV